jgi:hypothetical protein
MKTFLSNNGEISAVAVVTVLAVEDDVKDRIHTCVSSGYISMLTTHEYRRSGSRNISGIVRHRLRLRTT